MKKLVAALLLVLLMVGMTSALAGGQWVVDPVTGHEELVFDMEGWGDGELGDESIPLYALCGLALAAAGGAVMMHRKRQRVG